MTKEEFLEEVLTRRISDEEVNELSFSELEWLYKQAKKEVLTSQNTAIRGNITEILRGVRDKIMAGCPMYYAALTNGSPYQELTHYGTSIPPLEDIRARVFVTKEEAVEYVNGINERTNRFCAKRGREDHDIVHAEVLGYKFGSTALNDILRLDIRTVVIGNDEKSSTSLEIHTENLLRATNDPDSMYYNLAPAVMGAYGVFIQMSDEMARADDLETLKNVVFYQTANSKFLGCAISEQAFNDGEFVPITETIDGVEYISCYTDWVAAKEAHPVERIRLAFETMEILTDMNMPITLNGTLRFSSDWMKEASVMSYKADEAVAVLAACYGEDITTKEGDARCRRILSDIIKAKPIRDELYAGITRNSNGCDFTMPPDPLVSVRGYTARALIGTEDSSLCENFGKAYHVMSLLYNDPTGENFKAFTDAELFE